MIILISKQPILWNKYFPYGAKKNFCSQSDWLVLYRPKNITLQNVAVLLKKTIKILFFKMAKTNKNTQKDPHILMPKNEKYVTKKKNFIFYHM